ncbi:Aste57867_13759 [Aphanomyces stellatus]|uniref:Aste57867_13759 protein n=1 Tax=Aphanomyces stellatus TaxID=120398 RepID=A0A485KZN9_9STRA|nr:hypothetical protein As57867_013709 [Aphanomyces stellatus]VFT90592.1 Aste57867_13759 [Aphanomyces stellatus]
METNAAKKRGARAQFGVVFPHGTAASEIDVVLKKLKEAKLTVTADTITKDQRTFLHEYGARVLTVSASRERLEAEAESMNLLKAVVEPQREVKPPSAWDFLGTQFQRKEPFEVANAASVFLDYLDADGPHRFFSLSEETFLLQRLMERTLRHVDDASDTHPHEQGHSFQLVPLHDSQAKIELWNSFKWSLFPSNLRLANAMEAYFGAKVALYFAWLHFFTLFLSGPAVLGGALALYESITVADASGDSMVAPFFTLFMVVWSACFAQYWHRRSASLVCGWGIVESTAFSRRRGYHGLPHVNIFSGERNMTFPYYLRLYKYLWSTACTGGMLLVAFCVMVVSLNFQGYVHAESLLGAYLHIPIVHQFSLPGAIFDQQGAGPYPWLLPYIPTTIHCSCILGLNLVYRGIAMQLTDWENHKTIEEFDDALILKRFLFEAFDCYIALFYLAFCQLDVVLLRNELVSLYSLDTIRRVGLETVLPLVLRVFNARFVETKKTDDDRHTKVQVVDELSGLDEYEAFDDYMEKVIEFGYIVLFASCFPLAALLSLASNLVELKADQFKMLFVSQRPHVHRATSVGIWQNIITGLVWLSVLTNVFLFGFTTEQMMIWFPSLFSVKAVDDAIFGGVDHIHVAATGRETVVMAMVFGMEHLAFLLVHIVFSLIPGIPDSVAEENARRQVVLIAKKTEHRLTAKP